MPTSLFARVVLVVALALGFALHAHVVFTDDGINWPDEIYQSFEPAHRLVFGHGMVAWEYVEGARTWAVPAFVAVWLFLCKLVGADSPAVYVPVVKLAFSLLALGAGLGVYRLARAHRASEAAAAVAAAVWSLSSLSLYFSHRAMSENLAAAGIVWGVALALDPASTRRQLLLGASALGLATLARVQTGVVCVAVLLVLAARWLHSRRAGGLPAGGAPRTVPPLLALRDVALGLVAWAAVYGAWDALAWHAAPGAKWGGLFHSAVVYWRFNVTENRAAGWGTAAWTYFFAHLWRTMPGVTLALGLGLLGSLRRAPGVVLVVAAFVALHLAVAHKELRFIVPAVPLACALVSVALTELPGRARQAALGLVLLAPLHSVATYRRLTMGDVGSYPERPDSSAWDDFGPVNRLLLAASRQPDVCGLRVDSSHLAWCGGSTYLHRNARLYPPGFPHQHGLFNYVLTRPGSGAQVVAKEGPWELVRLPGVTACAPHPGYDWQLH